MESLGTLNAVTALPAGWSPSWRRPACVADIFASTGARLSVERNGRIFDQEERTTHVYRLISGTVRICRYLSDGKRQISAFHITGETFGFEPGAQHRFCAEAVDNCVLLVVRRSTLMEAAARDAAFALELWSAAESELQGAREHMLLLGRQNAAERILSFLGGIARRLGDRSCVQLPMGRQDMADHLGLTIETVSRTMSQLAEAQAIAVEGIRRVRIGHPASYAA